MRILYFSPRECWPLNTGARLRDFHFASQLARQARVTYLGQRNPKDPPLVLPPANSGFGKPILVDSEPAYTPINLIRGLLGPVPVTVLNFWSAKIAAEIEKLQKSAKPPDSVQMEGMHLVQYLPLLRNATNRPPVIADWHNIESELMRRYSETVKGLPQKLYARRTADLIEKMEARLLRGCDAHIVASTREREKLLARAPKSRIEVIGNGVDVAAHSDDELNSACARGGFPIPEKRRDILFVGSMDYHANIDAVLEFADQVWPGIHARHPGFRFVVVGRNPPENVRELAKRPNIEITGTVDDVRPWYRSALLVVVPLRTGSGTRLKILEAMAAGVPVVSTRLGAEGLEAADGVDLILAETPEETMNAIDRLFQSRELWHSLAEAGRKFVRERYDWALLGRRLFELHESLRPAVRQ